MAPSAILNQRVFEGKSMFKEANSNIKSPVTPIKVAIFCWVLMVFGGSPVRDIFR